MAILLASPALFAQRASGTSPSPFGRILFPGGTSSAPAGTSGTPFGRILFPGTGAPAVTRNVQSAPAPPARHPGHGGGTLIPYPVYFGGNNYVQYDPPQAPLASDYSVNSGQPDATPVVIVNQYFRPDAPPPVAGYTQPTSLPVQESRVTAENQDKETIFLIAMKDHTIYAAKAYWVEENTLNYVTIQGSQNSASMDLVDRDLSRRLNRDRQVAFGLPSN
jgi:hypothetical protein